MIRLKISDRPLSGGPEIFRKNFIKEASLRSDISILKHKNFDCELCFISFRRTHNKPVFLRLDGCYTDKKRFGMNKSIVSSIRNSNYQIYQSEFSQNLFKKMLKVDVSQSSVIHNGVDTSVFTHTDWEEKDELSFVSCATWRTNKRPNSIIRGFLEADIKDSKLYFIGGGRFDKIKDPRIEYLGEIGNSEVVKYLKKSKYYINLSHIESCPNSVIEAILCGCKIIYGNGGGTSELLESNDVRCDIDLMFSFKPQDGASDFGFADAVSRSMVDAVNLPFIPRGDTRWFSIEKCVNEYVLFMKSRLK